MNKALLLLLTFCLPVVLITGSCKGQSFKPVSNGGSAYSIVIPDDAGRNDRNAAMLLKKFIKAATGNDLPLVTEKAYKGNTAFYIGQTSKTTQLNAFSQIEHDGFLMVVKDKNIFICGKRGHASEYGVYHFAETYLGCRKYDAQPAYIPKDKDINLPADLSVVSNPDFIYRQSYYPMSNDAEYLNWHGLHRFEDLWGIWGHSYFKLIPPGEYFASHPEYFSLVNGKRKPTQLCLSNPAVLQLVILKLKQKMAANPDAEYWSVSPNDGGGNCTCEDCKKADAMDGSPSGSLIRFVNQVAAAFPDKEITTLGYGFTAHAPLHTKPANNVIVLLSTIGAYREKPLPEAASAAGFRNDLDAWKKINKGLFVWDYTTEFTNYLAPFPMLNSFQPNLDYFNKEHISGVFEQGSGDTYSDMATLYSYVQAKLLWNSKADVKAIISDFCQGYYGKGASYIQSYLEMRQNALAASGKHLDIYGNPIEDRRSFMSPQQLKQYDDLLKQASTATTNPQQVEHIHKLVLALNYVKLQQARHFGTEEYGFLQSDDHATAYKVKPEWKEQVQQFVTAAKQAGVTELSEGGLNPDQYQEEWNAIFNRNWPVNLAYNAKVDLQYPFAEDYPAKGNHTLTDGMTGFSNFSYNWLCFYGTDMVATLSAANTFVCSSINLNFLDDPRHWIFLPEHVSVSYSEDGVNYKSAGEQATGAQQEHEGIHIRNYSFKVSGKVRFIKVIAKNNAALPSWQNYSTKKPMIACDEIMALP